MRYVVGKGVGTDPDRLRAIRSRMALEIDGSTPNPSDWPWAAGCRYDSVTGA
jgi:hypothetical protein